MLKKEKSKWVVYDSKGKRKLGTHDTREKAVAQIAAIEASKAAKAKESKK